MTGFFTFFRRALCVALVGACTAFPSLAADGHDHGDAPAAATGSASPRVEAHSELFELVGVVDHGQMTLYLDRYATNEPVANARIEYEAGTDKGVVAPQADGTYLVKFDALAREGELPFSFTVTAGADTDLLAGTLDLRKPHEEHAEAASPWRKWAGYALVALVVLIAAAVVARNILAPRKARA